MIINRLVTPITVVALWAALAGSAAGAQGAESTAHLLQRARAATGIDRLDRRAAFTIKGHATRLGVESDYSITFSLDGRFVERSEGPLAETIGFDGRTYWAADSTGITRKLELGDEELAATPIWILTGQWLAQSSPFEVEKVEPQTVDPDRSVLQVKQKRGLLSARLEVNRATALPVSLAYNTTTGDEVWTYSGRRTDCGLTLPESVAHRTGPLTDIYTVESISSASNGFEESFRRTSVPPVDTLFDPAIPATIPSVRARSGHTLIHPLINGKDVGWFFLDTGAEAMCITPQAAEAVGMPKFGEVVVSGIGGATTGTFRKGERFQLGPITIQNLNYVELDLAFLAPAFTQKIAGICGYDLFARSVVSLRPATGAVEIHDPKTFRLPHGRWQELFLHEKNAAVRCKFDGDREEVFRLDTGAGDTVSFHAPAVRRLGLMEARDTRPSSSGGVGGRVGARTGQIDWFEIGGYRFELPTVTFSQAETGSFADPYTAGNVGQTFLVPFTVVFDYGRKRAAFVRESERRTSSTGGTKL